MWRVRWVDGVEWGVRCGWGVYVRYTYIAWPFITRRFRHTATIRIEIILGTVRANIFVDSSI